jgi:hypothetical protein
VSAEVRARARPGRWLARAAAGALWISATVAAASSVAFLGLEADLPEGWTPEPPSSSMRLAQYRVGAADGAQVAVFYFGPTQGGTPEANIARWRSQFSAPGGGSVKPSVEHFEVRGMPVTLAGFRGVYSRGVGIGPQGEARPGQALEAAIVGTPRGQVFIQLFGDAVVVDAERPALAAFVRSLR